MKHHKIIYASVILGIIFLTSGYFYLVYKNNQNVGNPSPEKIQQALDKSISWVLKNQDTLIHTNNPVLWWFLDESASLSGNTELADLVRRYRNTVLDNNSVWSGYWIKKPPFTYIVGSLDYMEKYQQFFAYALSCDSELGEEAAIKEQLKISFCDWKPYYSSCSTHQLMGIRLLQNKNCGDKALYEQLSDQLATIIEKQLTWDPRVGDVYIQRALMLVDSGYKDKVKPIWLKRILDEQRSDGGWANFYKLFNITDEIEFGFGYKFPEIQRNPPSSFHTTAQAIYLLSKLQR